MTQASKLLGLETKQGVAYSPAFGTKPSLLAEVYRKGDWSIDIGSAAKHLLAGASKTIEKNKDISLDVNAGVATNLDESHSWYIGSSVKF